MEEKTEMIATTTTENQSNSQGWRNVKITFDMPASAIIDFFNVLNQRLCNIEDNFTVVDENNNKFTLTEVYALQAEAEQQQQQSQEIVEGA